MKNPAMSLAEAMKSIQELNAAIRGAGVPERTLALVHLRASQINGCSLCVDWGAKQAQKDGESADRLIAVSAWRESAHFNEAERAALALAEAATRLSDRSDAVPDEVWNEAARHFDEKALGGLVTAIALTNFFNRLNVTTRQTAAAWGS
ncbi:MAG TPA: carboxymuconolactone decarboxylase family protein [Terriglobales bacterium]|nr:carboxymuconolactone decarboxylase family protein [Terriglobales bacterium]